VVTSGKVIYVSDEQVEIPKMSGYRAGYKSFGPPIVVLSRNQAQAALDAADSIKQLAKGALVYRMHYENWGHHMLDITATTHRVICGHLNVCNYDVEALRTLSLVFFDPHPRHEGNFKRIWDCYSSNPLIYTMHDSFKKHAYVIKDSIAGWSYLSLFDGGWKPDHARTYYERLWKCLHLDTRATVRDINPIKITFIQRPLHESSKARSFVNVYDALPKLRQTFPGIEFDAHSLSGKTFDEVGS
jgi:hypothetical protein